MTKRDMIKTIVREHKMYKELCNKDMDLVIKAKDSGNNEGYELWSKTYHEDYTKLNAISDLIDKLDFD